MRRGYTSVNVLPWRSWRCYSRDQYSRLAQDSNRDLESRRETK